MYGRVFGTSISVGIGATIGWVSRLSTLLSQSILNHAVSGDQAADQATRAKSTAAGSTEKVFIEVGKNDEYRYLNNAVKRGFFEQALRALIAWNVLTNKVTSRASVKTGSWTDDAYSMNIGMWSNILNSTQSFTVSGKSVYLGLKYYSGAFGAADIFIDDILVDTIYANKVGISTQNNGFPYDQCGVLRYDNLSDTQHVVKVKIKAGVGVGETQPNVVYVQWCAGSQQPAGPEAYVLNIINMAQTAYNTVGGSLANTAEFNEIILRVVNEFKADNLPVKLVDVNAVVNTTTHLQDDIHTNDAGAIEMANAVHASVTSIEEPEDPEEPPETVYTKTDSYYTAGGEAFIDVDGVKRQVQLVPLM